MDLSALVAAVKEVSDAPRDRIEQWINDRYRRMVAESRWRMVETTIASTIAGTSVYAVAPELVDLQSLKVGDVVYTAASRGELWVLRDPNDNKYLSGPGIYVPSFDGAGGAAIELYPTPGEDGIAIVALSAYVPETLTGSDVPIIPLDMHDALLSGAIAESLRVLDARADLAAPYEDRFLSAIELMRRRSNSRIGSEPVTPRIKGVHF